MEKTKKGYSSIDEYIDSFPGPIQKKLEQIRKTIKELVPEAVEKISYQMPAFFFNGNLVFFAGFSKHIGFYPGANCIAAFKNDLTAYKHAKGSVQFPLDQPLPIDLIEKMVCFKKEENLKQKKRQ